MDVLVVSTEAPVVHGPRQGDWTYADWEQLPDDGNRYEIIDGVVYMTTAPSSFHQWIVARLERYIGIPAQDRNLAFTFFAPIGVLMPGCAPVQPDFVVIRKERAAILHNGRIMGAPDLIAEILSPGNAAYDEHIKRDAYEHAGVPEFLLVDPRTRTLRYFQLAGDGRYGIPQTLAAGDVISFTCLPGILVAIESLFAGAPDVSL